MDLVVHKIYLSNSYKRKMEGGVEQRYILGTFRTHYRSDSSKSKCGRKENCTLSHRLRYRPQFVLARLMRSP